MYRAAWNSPKPVLFANSTEMARDGDEAGLAAAKAKCVEPDRPRRLTGGQLVAIRHDVGEAMPVAALARKCGVPRSTLRSALGRTE